MTENEAIEILSNELIVITDMIGYCKDFEKESDLAIAYRVKRKDAHNIAISALKEVQQYRENGTVEECREAREKQNHKVLKFYGDGEEGLLLCPNCDGDLWDLMDCGFDFCPYCGQAIQWNENTEENI